MLIASAVALHVAPSPSAGCISKDGGWRQVWPLWRFSLLYALYAGCGFGRDSVARISIDAKGRAALLMRRNQTAFEAVLLPGSMVHRAFVFYTGAWAGGLSASACLRMPPDGRLTAA